MDFKRFSKDCRIALTEWLLCCNMVVTEKQVRSAKIKNGGTLDDKSRTETERKGETWGQLFGPNWVNAVLVMAIFIY